MFITVAKSIKYIFDDLNNKRRFKLNKWLGDCEAECKSSNDANIRQKCFFFPFMWAIGCYGSVRVIGG